MAARERLPNPRASRVNDVSEMLGVLAHEMRTPIAAILGYQELLSEGIYGSVDERGREPLDRIAYSARQLLHLIDGVQEISSPDGKRLHSRPEPFAPADVLRECLANAHADATGRNVKLEMDIPQDLPNFTGDADRFCRAIDLALAAAIKSSHGATLVFSAATDHEQLVAKIEGTGLILDRDDPSFVQKGGKLTGAGLRLAIVRAITHQMNGDLELTPAGAGTTIVLRFSEK